MPADVDDLGQDSTYGPNDDERDGPRAIDRGEDASPSQYEKTLRNDEDEEESEDDSVKLMTVVRVGSSSDDEPLTVSTRIR